jgi:hypothetical protein
VVLPVLGQSQLLPPVGGVARGDSCDQRGLVSHTMHAGSPINAMHIVCRGDDSKGLLRGGKTVRCPRWTLDEAVAPGRDALVMFLPGHIAPPSAPHRLRQPSRGAPNQPGVSLGILPRMLTSLSGTLSPFSAGDRSALLRKETYTPREKITRTRHREFACIPAHHSSRMVAR